MPASVACDVLVPREYSEDIVKKQFKFFSFLATVAAFALIPWSSALLAQSGSQGQDPAPQAQQAPNQPPDTQAPARPQQGQQTPSQAQPAPPPDQTSASDPSGSKEFLGTVVKQGDKYMFQDAASGTTYDIDHQDEVKKFDGKKVRVHGSLDASGKMIHVQ